MRERNNWRPLIIEASPHVCGAHTAIKVIHMATIAILDDDLAMDLLAEALQFRGHDAFRINSADEALQKLDHILASDLVVLDIIMPWPTDGSDSSCKHDRTAGMQVLRKVRENAEQLPVLAYSATQDMHVIEALADDPATDFLSKWERHSMQDLIGQIFKRLGLGNAPDLPQAFIVHGRDEKTKLAVKNYLQNTLGLPEPTILHEQPNTGRTIIEKFEAYAALASIVFVVLTPDDTAAGPDDGDDQKRRARQNVIFEMGYFLGVLGRASGRVILLYSGPLEIPSDIAGVCYIDITHGVENAGEQIRKELEHVEQ